MTRIRYKINPYMNILYNSSYQTLLLELSILIFKLLFMIVEILFLTFWLTRGSMSTKMLTLTEVNIVTLTDSRNSSYFYWFCYSDDLDLVY